jgi:FMN phosphatase YigB (HAD superfamily)
MDDVLGTLGTAVTPPAVILLDVDNTLFDNDGFAADLDARLGELLGDELQARYWALYETVRAERQCADYLEPLQRMRVEVPHDPPLLELSLFLLEYPFARRLYPSALEVIRHVGTLGEVVVLSDGDVVLQPHKIRRSGIWDAVSGRVVVGRHKEHELDELERRYPAGRYVMVDDKPHILAGMKVGLAERVTTVFVQQGHYAAESVGQVVSPPPDLTIARIDELLAWRRAPRR